MKKVKNKIATLYSEKNKNGTEHICLLPPFIV